MILIISIIIQIILDILLFAYHPKKSYYEFEHLNNVYYDNYIYNSYDYYQSFYFDYRLIDKMLQELINSKRINQAILAFAIILFIIFFILALIKIIKKCKDNNISDSLEVFCLILVVFSFLFIFINWSMALAIVAKVNRLRKKDGDKLGLTNKIKSGIVKSCIIITFQLILIIVQLIIVVNSDDNSNNFSPRIYPRGNYTYNTRTTTQVNNYTPSQTNPSTTRRVEVIHVRRQETINIRRIVPNEVSSDIQKYITAGKILFLTVLKFYDEQKFDGLTNRENITKEIIDILVKLSKISTDNGDRIPEDIIRLHSLQRNNDYLFLLILYLFPLVIMIIKIKIQLGIYKRSYKIVTTNVITVLEQLERNIESDVDGNIRENFRYRRQINKNTLINLVRA